MRSPDGPWPLATAPVLALALGCAPALWCAHLLSVRARRKLVASRGLADFADSVKPLLLGAFVLYLCTSLLLERYGAESRFRAIVVWNVALCMATAKMYAFYPVLIDFGALAIVTVAF